MTRIEVDIKKNYANKTVLVLAPHQDDEIDLACYTLLNLKDWNKFIVYSTNGDNKTPAEIRYQEAIKSAEVLGVHKDNVLFLGYGDNQEASTCVFYSNDECIVSAAGHTKTYGAFGIDDYHFSKYGSHSPYNYKSFKEDLKEVILDIRANLIICVDFDSHIDHRMLSLAFDEVMQEILSKPTNDYYPEVWKRFGYTMSYFAPEDYTSINNRENIFPPNESLHVGEYNLIGKSLYQWDDRIRVPASGNNGLFISTHSIVKALKQHVSQYALFRAFRMDNSDEVFWRKRTDNLALIAKVVSSEGDATKLNDFKYYDTKDIDKTACSFDNDTWNPPGEAPSVSFVWERDVEISQIVIYGSILGKSYNGKIEISIGDNNYYKKVTIDDKPFRFNLSSNILTNTLKIVFLDGFAKQNGIAEIEIFKHKEYQSIADVSILLDDKDSKINDVRLINRIIHSIDKCWMISMRIRSYFINYGNLIKHEGVQSTLLKIRNRLR